MYTRHLSVADFRSWTIAELPLTPGINVLVGRNGVGKTNLVEALGYLATLSSHRVSGDVPLIRRGAERAIVRAAVVHESRELMLEVEITAGKANRARLNKSPLTRPRDMLGILRTVLFAPEDLALVRGDPSERRRYLDEVLIMRAPRFAGIKSDYDRALKQRNSLLKSAGAARRAGGGDLSTLEVWDEQLAGYGATLLAARLALVDEIRPHVAAAYADLAPTSAPADLMYRSSLGAALPAGGTEDDLRAAYLEEMQRLRRAELERGISLVGTHRDDVDLILGPGLAKGYASHGESWSFALALKMGGFGLLRSDGVDPVLILDDVFAELDSSRRSRLASLVADADQVLITAAVGADVPSELAGAQYLITEGAVTAVIKHPAPGEMESDQMMPTQITSAQMTPAHMMEDKE
ncbi:DNA replication/repair protein RecF [Nakamurella antarctica]|uniref:DNA replication and repair protein RecF n=1 Tax=Nakamurella antarctica TaxID=1902245 RepID=A0A3G8ZJ52_9ACTN|nr:DNA replication/repair protein RecF [Nakamurella antarctica]AZI56797.1 DNA replication/repair protein RecF [Nakamurella antarctica]